MAEPPPLTPEPSGPRERITSRRYRNTPFRYRQPYQNPLLHPRPVYVYPSPLDGGWRPHGGRVRVRTYFPSPIPHAFARFPTHCRTVLGTSPRSSACFRALPHAALRRRTSLHIEKAWIYSVYRIPDPILAPRKSLPAPTSTPPKPHLDPTWTHPLPLLKPTWPPLGPDTGPLLRTFRPGLQIRSG